MTTDRRRPTGVSLFEMLVTVTVIGFLAAVAAGSYRGVVTSSRQAVAGNTLETLNQAVNRYVQLNGLGLRRVAGDEASSEEEVAVLRALQWRSPEFPEAGTPYLRNDYDPPLSASQEDYRLVWSGSFFELLQPGVPGAGLRVVFDGSDLGRVVEFGEDYVPLSGY